MDISGTYTLKVPRERVWAALLDPDLLRRTIPGCERLEPIGDGAYKMRVTIGIAAVKGTYEGTLRLSDLRPPEHYVMTAEGSGARMVVRGQGSLDLAAPDSNTTVVNYRGKADLGGPLAGVAARVAQPAANTLIKGYFSKLEGILQQGQASADPAAADGLGD